MHTVMSLPALMVLVGPGCSLQQGGVRRTPAGPQPATHDVSCRRASQPLRGPWPYLAAACGGGPPLELHSTSQHASHAAPTCHCPAMRFATTSEKVLSLTASGSSSAATSTTTSLPSSGPFKSVTAKLVGCSALLVQMPALLIAPYTCQRKSVKSWPRIVAS